MPQTSEKPITKPIMLKELRAGLSPIKNTRVVVKGSLSPLESMALKVTEKVGSVGFFGLIFIWTTSWLLWNTLAPKEMRFDPFPAFVLWLFLSNMIQIFLMPLLLIGQNLQSRHSEIRAENDFNINLKAEKEIELVLQHLEYQNDLILEILDRTEKENAEKD